MANRTSLRQYRPCTITMFEHTFPALYTDFKESPHREGSSEEEKPAWHAFIPRLALTETDLDVLEENNVFSETYGINRRYFMGLQLVLPKKMDLGKPEKFKPTDSNKINEKVCQALRLLARRSEEVASIQRGLIPPIYVTRTFFRELIVNFDKLFLKIEIHGESIMQFVMNGHVIEVVDDQSLYFPDTQVVETYPADSLTLKTFLDQPRLMRRTDFKAIAPSPTPTDVWVIDANLDVKAYCDILGLRTN